MKHLFIFLMVVGFCSAQTNGDVVSKENLHSIGVRKSVFFREINHTSNTYKTSGKREGTQLRYNYKIGNRWSLGVRYEYATVREIGIFQSNEKVTYDNLLKHKSSHQRISSTHALGLSGSYDILQLHHFILRANLYLGLESQRNDSYLYTFNSKDSKSGGRLYDITYKHNNLVGRVMDIFIDALIPINNSYEIGFSFAISGNSYYGVYGTVNFIF